MDWYLAIKRNSEVLVEIVADLFALLGLALTDTAARLPWPAYRAALRVLRPAESALRRLIFIAARGLVVKPALPRCKPAGPVKTKKKGLRPRREPPPSSFSIRANASCCRAALPPPGCPRASTSSPPIPAW
jgi:hypothetical protein